MSITGRGSDWRADEIGRLYDQIGEVRESRIESIRELESTGQHQRLANVLDELYAVIDAFADKIEFLIEFGDEWFDQQHGDGPADVILQKMWRTVEAEEEAVKEWRNRSRPQRDLQTELESLHRDFLSLMESRERARESGVRIS